MRESRLRLWSKRLGWLALQLGIAALVVWLAITVPLPRTIPQPLALVRVPVAVLVFIVYVGKTLYDTFYFERPP